MELFPRSLCTLLHSPLPLLDNSLLSATYLSHLVNGRTPFTFVFSEQLCTERTAVPYWPKIAVRRTSFPYIYCRTSISYFIFITSVPFYKYLSRSLGRRDVRNYRYATAGQFSTFTAKQCEVNYRTLYGMVRYGTAVH